MSERPIRILFVCLGNICRSPLAEGLFRHHVDEAGLEAYFEIDSAGTGGWHAGDPPDRRMCATALARGIDISGQRARQIRTTDLARFDYVIVMDRENLSNTRALGHAAGRVELFRKYDPEPDTGNVPDPYYGGDEGFAHVFDIVDRTSRAFLAHLRREHGF